MTHKGLNSRIGGVTVCGVDVRITLFPDKTSLVLCAIIQLRLVCVESGDNVNDAETLYPTISRKRIKVKVGKPAAESLPPSVTEPETKASHPRIESIACCCSRQEAHASKGYSFYCTDRLADSLSGYSAHHCLYRCSLRDMFSCLAPAARNALSIHRRPPRMQGLSTHGHPGR